MNIIYNWGIVHCHVWLPEVIFPQVLWFCFLKLHREPWGPHIFEFVVVDCTLHSLILLRVLLVVHPCSSLYWANPNYSRVDCLDPYLHAWIPIFTEMFSLVSPSVYWLTFHLRWLNISTLPLNLFKSPHSRVTSREIPIFAAKILLNPHVLRVTSHEIPIFTGETGGSCAVF